MTTMAVPAGAVAHASARVYAGNGISGSGEFALASCPRASWARPERSLYLRSRACPTCARGLRLSNSARVGGRTGVMLEALAQLDKLRLVGQEVPVVVHHLVGEDRFVAGRRRNVATH